MKHLLYWHNFYWSAGTKESAVINTTEAESSESVSLGSADGSYGLVGTNVVPFTDS